MGLILVDTYIILYLMKGRPEIKPFLEEEFALSELSEIELLGVKDINKDELNNRQKIINDCFFLYFNQPLKKLAITLKQKYPDAIIAATAIHFKLHLLTADKGFTKIKELDVIPLILESK